MLFDKWVGGIYTLISKTGKVLLFIMYVLFLKITRFLGLTLILRPGHISLFLETVKVKFLGPRVEDQHIGPRTKKNKYPTFVLLYFFIFFCNFLSTYFVLLYHFFIMIGFNFFFHISCFYCYKCIFLHIFGHFKKTKSLLDTKKEFRRSFIMLFLTSTLH